jgi:hypothetical protein
MSVIELGDVTAGDGPSAASARRRLDRRSVIRSLALLIGVLCLFTVNGSAVPAPRGPGRSWRLAFAGADDFALAGGIFVLHNGGTQLVSGYRWAGGPPRWSRRLSEPATSLVAAPDAGVLLLPTGPRSVETRTGDGGVIWNRYSLRTIALDAATGRELWQGTGDVAVLAADSVLLVEYTDDGAGVRRLRLVRLHDGATIWTRAGAGAYAWTGIGADSRRPTGLATVTPTGALRVYRFADGAPLATATVPWRTASLTGGTLSQLYGDHGLLYLVTTYPDSASVAAYDPGGTARAGLRPVWQATSDSGNAPAPCGEVVCVPTAAGLTGRDWATGAQRWRAAGYDLGRGMTGHLMLAGSENAGRAVLDDRTGRVRFPLGQGGAAWDAGTAVALAPTVSPPGRLAVTRLDPGDGPALLLGAIEPVINTMWCQLQDLRLACQTARSTLVVTDVG